MIGSHLCLEALCIELGLIVWNLKTDKQWMSACTKEASEGDHRLTSGQSPSWNDDSPANRSAFSLVPAVISALEGKTLAYTADSIFWFRILGVAYP